MAPRRGKRPGPWQGSKEEPHMPRLARSQPCLYCGRIFQSQAKNPRFCCTSHYAQFRYADHQARFWKQVQKTDSCWLWTGRVDRCGYGAQFLWHRTLTMPHRYAYELLVGPVAEGLTLDHLCRNRLCVNPAHMEPVTLRENILRGDSPHAINARKTHCKHGHAFDEANTHHGKYGRTCITCRRANVRRAYWKARSPGGTQ
jgi:hypothetical protein